MTTWAERFQEMTPEERVMTIAEDPSTLEALLAESFETTRAEWARLCVAFAELGVAFAEVTNALDAYRSAYRSSVDDG